MHAMHDPGTPFPRMHGTRVRLAKDLSLDCSSCPLAWHGLKQATKRKGSNQQLNALTVPVKDSLFIVWVACASKVFPSPTSRTQSWRLQLPQH